MKGKLCRKRTHRKWRIPTRWVCTGCRRIENNPDLPLGWFHNVDGPWCNECKHNARDYK